MNIEESVEYLKNCLNDEYNFKNATRKKDKEAIETLLTAYEKQKDKIKKAIDFINDENNFFEDGENWQNVLKIKEILEEE